MKVTKWVEFEKEVEISISAEDIISAIAEDPNFKVTALHGFNNFYRFYRAIPLQVLAEIEPAPREVLHKFFIEVAEQFRLKT